MLRIVGMVMVLLCSSACQTAAWSFIVPPHCEAAPTNWLSRAFRWVRSIFCEPPPLCNEQDIFLKKFFSLDTWTDDTQSEEVLAELSTHTEVSSHGPKELIVEYIHKMFVDFVGVITMELKDKGIIDVTPLMSFVDSSTWPSSSGLSRNTATPVVIVPGLSGACQGLLEQVANFLKHYLNTEHVECIAEGESLLEQIGSSWFLGAGDAVEHFRQRVLSNPVYMERGFNVLAFSQGNFIARGYVQQFNGATIDGQAHPIAKSWISMNGPLLGQGGVPTVDQTGLWGIVHSAAGLACGHAFLGSVVTPCGYLRVPGWINRNRLVAKLNGEDLGPSPGQAELEAQEAFLAQSKENFGRLESLVAVRSRGDTVIMPNEAQWFGTYGSSFDEVLSFRETAFYQQDTFGLKTLDTTRRLHFLETPGGHQHCIFSASDLKAWVDEHWVQLGSQPDVAAER